MLDIIIDRAKSTAAAVGVVATLSTGYVAAGLPIPATQAFVRTEVATVAGKIDGLTIVQLELQRRQIVYTRAKLRYELASNASMRVKVDAAYRLTLERRTAEINDELAALDREDEELRTRIVKMRGG